MQRHRKQKSLLHSLYYPLYVCTGFREVAFMVATTPTTGLHLSRPMIANPLLHCEAALAALKRCPGSVRLSGPLSLLRI